MRVLRVKGSTLCYTCVKGLYPTRVERLCKTCVLQNIRHFCMTRVLRSCTTRVLQVRKTRVKHDTMSDFPLLPLGMQAIQPFIVQGNSFHRVNFELKTT